MVKGLKIILETNLNSALEQILYNINKKIVIFY